MAVKWGRCMLCTKSWKQKISSAELRRFAYSCPFIVIERYLCANSTTDGHPTPQQHIYWPSKPRKGPFQSHMRIWVPPSLLKLPLKKSILIQNFTKISKIISRSDVSTSRGDTNLSSNIIMMSGDRIPAVYDVLRVLLGCRRCSIPVPKKAEWRV